jgi:hypothetical protein
LATEPEPVDPWVSKIDRIVKRVRSGRRAAVLRVRGQRLRSSTGSVAGAKTVASSTKTRVTAATVIFLAVAIMISLAMVQGAESERQAQAEAVAVQQQARSEAAAKLAREKADRATDERAEARDQTQALEDGPAKVAEADVALAAAPWADLSNVAALTAARDLLRVALERKDGAEVERLVDAVTTAIPELGSLAQAQDRVFAAGLAAAGRPSDPAYDAARAVEGRAWCTETMGQWSDPTQQWKVIGELRESTDVIGPAATSAYCPEVQAVVDEVKAYLVSGNYRVGAGGIAPGTWSTRGAVEECYWERHTGNGDIIDNNFVTAAPDGVSVTVREGEGISMGARCGYWTKTG